MLGLIQTQGDKYSPKLLAKARSDSVTAGGRTKAGRVRMEGRRGGPRDRRSSASAQPRPGPGEDWKGRQLGARVATSFPTGASQPSLPKLLCGPRPVAIAGEECGAAVSRHSRPETQEAGPCDSTEIGM